MNAPLSLGAAERSRVRKALTQNPGWKAYKARQGVSIDTMPAAALLAACSTLGVNVQGVISGQAQGGNEPEHVEGDKFTVSQVQAEALRCVYRAALHNGNMDPMDKACGFIDSVFERCEKRQDGKLSVRQFEAIKRSLARHGAHYTGGDEQQLPRQLPADAAEQQREIDAALAAEQPQPKPATNGATLTPAASPSDAGSQLAALIAQMAGAAIKPEQVAAIVDERINAALSRFPAVRIEVSKAGEVREIDGHHHPKFTTLLKAAGSRMASGYAPSIWLAGPAGSGKTHAAHMTANALAIPFHYNGALSMPHELLGFIDAGGTYHRTPFREAFEHGGVYLFDEVDASDNSALLALNAALANGTATFPDAQIKRHADSVIIATANTWGLGATADYVGRSKIDAAFLSRFPVRIGWDYDTALEVAISGHEGFARRVIAARERARAAGIKVMIDPRASQAGAALIATGFSQDDAAELTYLANLSAEQRRTVEGRR